MIIKKQENHWSIVFKPKSLFLKFKMPSWAENIGLSFLNKERKKPLKIQVIIGRTETEEWIIHKMLLDKKIAKNRIKNIAKEIKHEIEKELYIYV